MAQITHPFDVIPSYEDRMNFVLSLEDLKEVRSMGLFPSLMEMNETLVFILANEIYTLAFIYIYRVLFS